MEYSDELIQAVWEKGRAMPGRNGEEWRQDQCGAWLNRDQYGNDRSEFGWKILNVVPGGAAKADGLQPFHCKNSFDLAIGKAHCRVSADRSGLGPTQQVDQPRNTSSSE